MLDHTKMPYATVLYFAKLYAVPFDPSRTDLVDLENPPPSQDAQLPCAHAVEFLADIHERGGVYQDIGRAIEVRVAYPIS
jgi:protein farnesyltransferase/geranylgeranyltransferase type-1 subunit alpha